MKIYHQLGYRYNWNIESLNQDHTGNGVILNPRHITSSELERINFPKSKMIFDPQFFIPSQSIGGLSSYTFYPNQVVNNFSTASYTINETTEIAKNCLDFQVENDFEFIVIPSRPYGINVEEYITEQEKFLIYPFLDDLKSRNIDKKIILQVVINQNFILDKTYFDEFVNWIVSINGIDGVYLLIEHNFRTKQIEDIDFLFGLMNLIYILNTLNEKFIILGYLNLESLLLSIAGPNIITIGSFENLRRFKVDDFKPKDPGERRHGPTPRIYISKLIQLIDFRYKDSLLSEFGKHIFDYNKYQALMFQPTYNWNFQKPELYKHYFLVFSEQLNLLSPLPLNERYFLFKSMVQDSINFYEKLEEVITFDKESQGNHLPKWLTAANRFAKLRGWI